MRLFFIMVVVNSEYAFAFCIKSIFLLVALPDDLALRFIFNYFATDICLNFRLALTSLPIVKFGLADTLVLIVFISRGIG